MKLNRRMVLWGCVMLAVLSAGLVLPLLASAGFTAAPVPEPRHAPDAPASSVTYTVNVISDTILTAGCTSGSGSCSLRGAVQLANGAGGTPLILFASNVNGMTITLGSTLLLSGGHIVLSDPAFTKTLISAPNNAPAFTLSSDSNELDYMEIAGGGSGGGGAQDGVFISSGAHNLLFGDALYHLGGQGVSIAGTGVQNNVSSSFIGVKVVGGVPQASCAAANNTNGIELHAPNSLVVGNTIGCNASNGIRIAFGVATSNYILGNYIGVTAAGQPIPNGLRGVEISNGATNNVIGQAGAAPNVIAYNALDGVYISDAGTSGNTVANNIIGLGPTGTLAAGNGTNGVWIDNAADSNAIGGRVLTEANTIAGNGGAGILINGIGANNISDTRFNLVVGNRIGLNAAGAAAAPNGGSGILVSNGAWGNTLGNLSAELRNTIAGNGGDGVTILSANSTTVAGNLIGRNISDTANIGNAKNGVRLDNGASFNAVQDNVIDSNGAYGIVISGTATTTNTLPANVIGNNFSNGLMLQSGTRGNIINGGLIEVNGGQGIALDGAGTSNNLITGTLSALNPLAGIREHNGAANNVWSHISTFSNGGLGIDKDPYLAPTGPYPTILSVSVNGGSVTVGGKASAAILQSVKVELYRVALDPSGFGEGQTYLGSGNADGGGNWSLTFAGASGCFTAFQTTTNAFTSVSASSEFGPNSCRIFLPLVVR